jgi:hypothetical protein
MRNYNTMIVFNFIGGIFAMDGAINMLFAPATFLYIMLFIGSIIVMYINFHLVFHWMELKTKEKKNSSSK